MARQAVPTRRGRTHGGALRGLSIATAALFLAGYALAFFYAPLDVDQGFVQKIFYVHVPMAIVTLIGFIAGGLLAIAHLRTRDPKWDLRSYVAIHISLILAVGVLITGAIWAKASWGAWWVWEEPTLVSFLIVFLLYATYQPLRFSIEDPERQARYASVFAIVAGAFVPLNFIAVRLAEPLIHPRVLGTADGGMPGPVWLTFLVCLVAFAGLFATLWWFELSSKQTKFHLRRLRRRARRRRPAGAAQRRPSPRGRALMPALPLDEAGKYVAAAYVVFLALLLIYVAIMAFKLQRIQREVAELAELAAERERPDTPTAAELAPAAAPEHDLASATADHTEPSR